MKLFGRRGYALRAVFSLVLSVLAVVVGGCAICPSPYDYDYNAFGGTHDRVDRCRGRAGSAFEPTDSRLASIPQVGEAELATPELETDTQ